MAAKTIELDFLQPAGPGLRLGPLLLLVGGLLAMGTLVVERNLADTIRARETQIEEVRSLSRRAMPALQGKESDTPELRDEIKKANAVLGQLNVPWSDLFAAIESAQDPEVALLSVQPDPRGSSVSVSGQGRTLQAVLDYLVRLQRTQRLRDVVLVSHELKAKEPGRPVAFLLNAQWVERR